MPAEPVSAPDGTDLIWLEEVDSTMDEAARRGPGLQRPTWIATHRQTGGRGRGGKPWLAPEGNLQATWVAPVDLPLSQLPLLSFVAALALRDTLLNWIDKDRVAFKWPNDVLVDGGKIAGILLESSGSKTPRVSVGIGVNLATAPSPDALPVAGLPPVSVAQAMRPGAPLPPTPEMALSLLARDFDRWSGQFRAEGFDSLRRIWLQGAANIGAQIRVALPRETLTGRFVTVDPDGQLVLEVDGSGRRIAAGEVFFDI